MPFNDYLKFEEILRVSEQTSHATYLQNARWILPKGINKNLVSLFFPGNTRMEKFTTVLSIGLQYIIIK